MIKPATLLTYFSVLVLLLTGCTTMKQSDTARTGVEQLLISSAADRALDKIDYRPITNAKVYVEAKYLDCVDKNYILLALRQRLMRQACILVDKPEDAQVIVEIASGSVGTDRNDLFLGSPEIPLPPPSPIAIPRMPLVERSRAMGTAKLVVVAYDAQSKLPVINGGYALARSDHKTWNVLGVGGINSGSVHQQLAEEAGDVDTLSVPTMLANRSELGLR